jgi:hypothetical protein
VVIRDQAGLDIESHLDRDGTQFDWTVNRAATQRDEAPGCKLDRFGRTS